jgi:hypothetical protein
MEDKRTNIEKTTLSNRLRGDADCSDWTPSGRLSERYDYVLKTIGNGLFYDECEPWLYGNMQVDNLQINGTATGNFQGTINVQSWKGFDIKHPNKDNHRLRHICLEGPEAGIYIRGTLKDSNVITLPDYWRGLIDPESITVHLTQIAYSQDLIVERIEWGQKIYIKSNNGNAINCYYEVKASRIDGKPLIVEYEGESPEDYPDDFSQFSISGYDY